MEAHGTGLHSLARELLNIQVEKHHRLRCSNWENYDLTKSQIAYASADAWVSRELFRK